jgi:hypothetical protein
MSGKEIEEIPVVREFPDVFLKDRYDEPERGGVNESR